MSIISPFLLDKSVEHLNTSCSLLAFSLNKWVWINTYTYHF
jgi:hypothetical protein